MQSRRIALLLIVVGCLCLPAPIYLSWAANATAPPPHTSQVYSAEPLDPANQSDRAQIVDRHGSATSLSIHQVSDMYSAGEYCAPNETHRTLETAMQSGSATVENASVQVDLRMIVRNNTFVYDAYGGEDQYYRVRLSENGSGVETEPISLDLVANATIDRAAVRYADLSPGEQITVDRILANSSEGDFGYRPRVEDPFVDRLPELVFKDDTLYSLFVSGHVDDFGPGFTAFIGGLVGTGIGVVLSLVGTGMYYFGGTSDTET